MEESTGSKGDSAEVALTVCDSMLRYNHRVHGTCIYMYVHSCHSILCVVINLASCTGSLSAIYCATFEPRQLGQRSCVMLV